MSVASQTGTPPLVRPSAARHRAGVRPRPDGATVVGHNRWDLLEPPEVGTYRPSLWVSVVIPHYRSAPALERTLAALAEQTYPAELTEVVVVDDGSDPPLRWLDDGPGGIARPDGLDVRLLHQPRRGFGAARARNLGAVEATGDLLLFLDCDMLPEREVLEAHARWHHVCDHAVTLGVRRHVEVDDLDAATLARAVREGRLAELLADRPQQVPGYIDGHLARTDHLRGPHDDLFRVVAAGNLGVRRDLFDRVGGFDATFAQWGGEDTEVGYRLFTAGAVLVPEPQARCWHQGAGHEPDDAELRSLDEQRARLAQSIAHRGFRRTRPGRLYQVPRVDVEVVSGPRHSRAEVLATVESVLASELTDLVVHLRLPEAHPDHTWLVRQFAGDPRVVLHDHEVPRHVPFQVQLPAGAVIGPSTVGDLVDRLTDVAEPVGVLQVTVPRRRPADARLRAWTTRALARGRRTLPPGWPRGRDRDDVRDEALRRAGELFGDAWVSGNDLAVRWWADEATVDAVPDAAPRRAGGDAQAEAMELWQVVSRLSPAQRRRIVGTARAALSQLSPRQLNLLLALGQRTLGLLGACGALLRARSLRDLRRALGRTAEAVLPRRFFERLMTTVTGVPTDTATSGSPPT